MKLYSLARWSLFVITLFWVAVIASTQSFSAREQSPATSKIAPWILEKTANGEAAEFLVVLDQQADLSGADALKTKQEKGRFVRDALWNKAQETQGPLLSYLAEQKIEHRSYYIVNLVWVKATAEVAYALAARADVARLEGNPTIRNVDEPVYVNEADAPQKDAPNVVEWGITNTGAPDVWAQGFTGQGLVVAGADTGYRWDHAAIKGKYRGWDGTNANHDYNWHDSIHSGGGTCGPNSVVPCDDNGHGTHTMGTIAGDDGAGNQVGMAPGAKWIGCRNMNQGNGTPATYIECFEFFLAPYPVNGTPAQGDPDRAPDVSNNSWGCPASEGCSPGSLLAAVQAQRAAGILTVVSAGNAGTACGSVNTPPATYDESFSVGSHTISNTISSFSSRGPVTLDGSNRLKPDITAPGSNVRSSTRTSTTSYGSLSGTSMAGPHVAGAVALLWSAKPFLRNDIATTEALFNQTAIPVADSTCGTPTVVPNYVWGFGRLNVSAAVNKLALMSAVSRKVHGAAGTFDIPLPRSGALGVECRNASSHTIVFTFNKPVASGNATVTEGTATAGAANMSGNTMSVTLNGVTDAQKITVSLNGVTATDNQVLEATSISMNMLVGDVNGSKVVNASDLGMAKAQSGVPVTEANFRNDVAVSGSINATDIGVLKSRSGASVP